MRRALPVQGALEQVDLGSLKLLCAPSPLHLHGPPCAHSCKSICFIYYLYCMHGTPQMGGIRNLPHGRVRQCRSTAQSR